MFVRWKQYRSVARWHRGKPPVSRVTALLVETTYPHGQPRQQHLACLASYRLRTRNDVSTRCLFWRMAWQRLDQIGDRITSEQRSKIEAALALHVRKPTSKQVARCVV